MYKKKELLTFFFIIAFGKSNGNLAMESDAPSHVEEGNSFNRIK